MRYRLAILFSVFVLLLAGGCTAAPSPTPFAEQPAPVVEVPQGISAPGKAAAWGRRLLEAEGFTWVGAPQVALAQEMTYAEAAQRIPAMSDPEKSEYWPDTNVWLVILRGQWDLMPMGPPGATLVPNRYQGCIMVLFTARDGRVVAMGDTLCPGS